MLGLIGACYRCCVARVLLISKSVTPPWNDSSKNLVRDIASVPSAHELTVLTRGTPEPLESPFSKNKVLAAPIYAHAAKSFQPATSDALRLLGYLSTARDFDIFHYFFAPNPRTSLVARGIRTLRKIPTLHTIASTPHEKHSLQKVLFAELNIVLSRKTEKTLLDGGVSRSNVVRIPPCVADPSATVRDTPSQARAAVWPQTELLVTYPGDLEFGDGALRTIRAFAKAARTDKRIRLLICARDKTVRARQQRAVLDAECNALGIQDRVRFLGTVNNILQILQASDAVLLPETRLFAKMDLPLVLLESMWLQKPILVCQEASAAECVDSAHAASKKYALCSAEVSSVAERLTSLMQSASLRIELGAHNRQHVATNYSPAVIAAAYGEVYARSNKRRR